MPTNWTVPTGADVRRVLAAATQSDPNQNLAEGTLDGDELDLTLANRRDELVAQAVAEVRGAIRTAGRYPYSVTAGAVPPEGVYHTLVVAAWRLVNSTPGLARSFLAGDGGAETPLAKLYKEAREWVAGLRTGQGFTPPDDPVGQDWATAVDDENLAVTGIIWGDSQGDDAEYAAGVTEDGVVISRQLNSMNTY